VLPGAIWGSSFLFIRVAVPALGPFVLMELRVGLAAAAFALLAVAVGRLPKLRYRWKGLLVLGACNAAIPFSLIAASEINLTASLAAILNATTVLFAAVVAAAWMGEALTKGKVAGLVMGIVGVAVLVGWRPIALNGIVLLSVGASLLAAFSYALGGVYAMRAFASVPAEAPSLPVTLSTLALALLCTAVAYLLYFYLISSVGPTKTLTVTFLSPVFGALFGVLFLDEPFGIGTFVGLGIILSSVALVTGIRFFGK
jgi:drug/metabolite transporter (DMT)-like permease